MNEYKCTDVTKNEFVSEPNDRFRLDDFELFQIAREFRKRIYQVIRTLPKEEEYALNGQMRHAIVSVTNNIAEAHDRWRFKESIQFCRISRGSTEEIIDDLNVCIDESYYDHDACENLKNEGYSLVKKTTGYISYLKKMKKTWQKE